MNGYRVLALSAVSAVALQGSVSSASAGAFALREQSVTGQGQAFAGAASGEAGLGSMFWNPATITMNPGWTSEANVTLIDPSARITTTAPTPTLPLGQSGDIGLRGAIPASFSAYQLTDTIWLGLASTAPFGLVTKPNTTWAGQTYSRSSRVFSANFEPILGIKVTDWLSIAAGPTIQYFKTRLNSAATPTPVAGQVILEGDDISAGYTVGATVTPLAGTTIGVGYRSSIHHEVEGTLRTPLAVVQTHVNLNLPDQINAGITQQITSAFKMSLGFEWTNWSRLKNPAVVLDATGTPAAGVPFGYKDGYYYAIGGEYQFDPRVALRGGIAYETSPIDQSNRGTRLPDTDRIHASIGATYKYSEKLDITASYEHIFQVGNRGIRIVPGNPVYNGLPLFGTVSADADIFGLAIKYRWDDPKIADATPLVRKY